MSSVIGTPFYIMEYVRGRIFKDPSLPELTDSEERKVTRLVKSFLFCNSLLVVVLLMISCIFSAVVDADIELLMMLKLLLLLLVPLKLLLILLMLLLKLLLLMLLLKLLLLLLLMMLLLKLLLMLLLKLLMLLLLLLKLLLLMLLKLLRYRGWGCCCCY